LNVNVSDSPGEIVLVAFGKARVMVLPVRLAVQVLPPVALTLREETAENPVGTVTVADLIACSPFPLFVVPTPPQSDRLPESQFVKTIVKVLMLPAATEAGEMVTS
jgi:hypothetical protein